MHVNIVLLSSSRYYDGVTFGAGPDYSPSNAHTDSAGIQWRADAFYSGTSTHVTDYRGVTYANTDDPSLYQTERYGMDFYYTLNVPNGQYTVELRFAESRFSSASSRVFSIAINGQQVEGQLDIFASAGGQNTAYISQYQATVSNGLLDIFFNSIVYEAKVSAIRVFTNGGGSPLPSPPSSVSLLNSFLSLADLNEARQLKVTTLSFQEESTAKIQHCFCFLSNKLVAYVKVALQCLLRLEHKSCKVTYRSSKHISSLPEVIAQSKHCMLRLQVALVE
jgi:hypothetical protein